MHTCAGVDSMNMGSLRAELAYPASYKSGVDTELRRISGGGASDDDAEDLDDDDLMMMVMGTTPQQQGARTWNLQAPVARFDNGQPAMRAQQVRRLSAVIQNKVLQ